MEIKHKGGIDINISGEPISTNQLTIEGFFKKISLPKRYFSGDFVISEKFDE